MEEGVVDSIWRGGGVSVLVLVLLFSLDVGAYLF